MKPAPLSLLLCFLVLFGTSARSSDVRFDGKWRLDLTYSRAASSDRRCSGHLLADPMTISNGKLSGLLNHSTRGTCFMRGAVDSNGVLKDAECHSARAFTLAGRIDGNAGTGTWWDSDTDTCDGRWTAKKIK
jgi:hypothetical protein